MPHVVEPTGTYLCQPNRFLWVNQPNLEIESRQHVNVNYALIVSPGENTLQGHAADLPSKRSDRADRGMRENAIRARWHMAAFA